MAHFYEIIFLHHYMDITMQIIFSTDFACDGIYAFAKNI